VQSSHIAFPIDRTVGFLVLLSSADPQRVDASGEVEIPANARVWFTCGQSRVDADDLRGLAAVPLEHVRVSGPFADTAVVALAESRVETRSLALGDGVTDEGMRALARYGGALEELTVEAPEVTDQGMVALAELASLTSLVLGVKRAYLPGEPEYLPPAVGLGALVHLRALEELVVGVSRLGAHDLAVLAELPALRRLNITRATVGAEALVALKAAALEALTLTGKLDDEALSSLAAVDTLRSLSFDPSESSPRGLLELRLALPELTVNGEWFSRRAVAKHLAALA